MFFFSSSKWDHLRISLIMTNFNNISSLTNVRCSFCLHQNEIILEFLSRWWISAIFDHWPASNVLFLFTKMTSCQNCSDDDELQQYFMIDQRLMFLFSSSKRDQFWISLMMMNFNNVWSLTNVQCSFPLHQHEIILEFLSRRWISTIFHHWPTSHVLFLFIKIGSFQNFYHHDEIQQYFMMDQRLMFFFSWSRWDDFRISVTTRNFNDMSSLTNVQFLFLLINIRLFQNFYHHDEIQQYFIID